MKNELKTYEITARGYVDHTVEIDAESKEDALSKLQDTLEGDERNAVIKWDTDVDVDEVVEIDAETKEANKLNLAFYHFSTAIIEQIGFDEFMKKQTELRNGFDALYADSK